MTHNVLVGTAGFSYKDWEGIVYPPGLKKKQHPLQFLAQYFDCCEINTSFYGPIQPKTGRKWCDLVREVNPTFEFTAKLFRSFTHAPGASLQSTSSATLNPLLEDESNAKKGLDSLAEHGKLGALLIQFPISFKNTDENRSYLESLLQRFRQYPLVVEVRHSTWDEPEVLASLAEQGVAFCNIDQPRLGRSLRATEHATSPIAYVRLHGRNYKEWFESDNRDDRYNYLYTPKELAPWKEKIDRLAQKAEKTFAVTNNHYKGQAAVNAIELKHMLKGMKVKAPSTLVEHYPVLKDITDPST
ncbi:MAG TPA: DUF72 domain-containing protein [Terriglobales bacterium]|nr:DUF72 domain-containing protein [Terriglobales bacterium]